MTREFIARVFAAALNALLATSVAAAEAPQLDMRVELDPASGAFAAQGELTLTSTNAIALTLSALSVQSATLDNQPLPAVAVDGNWTLTPDAPMIGKRLRIAYRGKITAMDSTLSQLDVLDAMPPMVSVDGSYLPAGSGWYPDPGAAFTYRVEVTTPKKQIAVVPGTPRTTAAAKGKRKTIFEHAFPADGIDLMVGPYTVSERRIDIAGKPVLVRTYFHQDVQALSADYLDSTANYLQRYSRMISAYPFTEFSIVSSPLPTGFGMPTLTYLGRQVLKLPFIRHTSLGHEVLHNWWGNGVRVDVSRGNWSEGLTTFMADYSYKEEADADAAKDMRHGWLRDLVALPADADRPLSEFRARHHTASSVIGYGKSAMLFLALRDRLGEEAFNRGLRQFWETKRFQAASFDDLRSAFERASSSDFEWFFDQWLERTGAPVITATRAVARGDSIEVTLTQNPANYRVRVPLRLDSADGARIHVVELDAKERRFTIPAVAGVRSITVDPEFRVWRRLAASEAPPILRDAVAAERLDLIALGDALQAAALQLAQAFAEGSVQRGHANSDGKEAPLLVAGTAAAIDRFLSARALPARPAELSSGDVQVWIAATAPRRVILISLPEDGERAQAALRSLSRRLPHLARYAWLRFDKEQLADKGNWPAQSPVVEIRR